MLPKTKKLLILIVVLLALALGIFLFAGLTSHKFLISKGQVKNETTGISLDQPLESATATAASVSGAAAINSENSYQSSTPAETVIAFGGDVMLSRVVGQQMVKYQDWSWPFIKVSKIFDSADLAAVNLESPFTVGGNHFVPTGSYSFNADPLALAGLKLAGIDIVTLANNHIFNQGRQGIIDTGRTLDTGDIKYVGAGEDFTAAHEGKILEAKGIKFGFLGYAYPDDYSIARENSAGIAGMDLAQMKADISRLKKQADVIIIEMHDGTEYTAKPNEQQKQFARAAIAAGADLIIGHHPHWVQSAEIYRGKLILYSLGNLVFDQMWSTETRQGAIARVYFSGKNLEKAEIIPIQIYDYGQPAPAGAEEAAAIIKRMGLEQEVINL